jgi:hypothetical protein
MDSTQPTRLLVSHVSFKRAERLDELQGLLGHVRFHLNGALRIDGASIRRTLAGRIQVFFPERIDQDGRSHAIVWPLTADVRQALERQILGALRRQGVRL